MRRSLAILGGLLVPAMAGADGTVGLRVTQAGFDWIADEVTSRVPSELDLADQEVTLLECWSDDSVARFADAHVEVDRFHLEMPIVDDQLTAELSTDVRMSGLAAISAIGCLPLAAECEVTIEVDQIALHADVEIVAGEDGAPTLHVSALDVELAPERFRITLGDCTGDVQEQVNPMIEQAEPSLIQMMDSGLRNWANEAVQPMLAHVLGQTILVPVDQAQMDATVTVRDIAIDGSALEMTTDVGLTGREIAACVPSASEPAVLDEDHGVEYARWDPSPFAVAISERLIDEALVAVWQAGLLCTPSYEVDGFGGILPGIPGGVDLTVGVQVGSPPDARISPEGLSVELRGVEIVVGAEDEEGGQHAATFRGTITSSADFDVDPGTNGLRVVMNDLDLAGLELVEGGLPEGTDVDLFMSDVVFPLALDKFGDLRVIDAVLPITDYWMIINAIDYFDESMSIVFDLFHAPEDDHAAPDTIVLEAPADVVRPGSHEIVVTGTDDEVPERLLRFRIRADAGDWEEPTFSPLFTITDHEVGLHTWYVQAIDLNGNEDPDPAKVTFEVTEGADEGHPEVEPPIEGEELPTTGGEGESGCGCRAGGGAGGASALYGLAGVVLLLARRRRA